MTGYTFKVRVYLGKTHKIAAEEITTHTTVRHLTSYVEEVGCKLFMDNFFSSLLPYLMIWLLEKKLL